MSKSENFAGFNLTSSKLQLVEVAVIENQLELLNVDEAFLNEEINFENDKISKIGALLQSAYEELQLNNKLNPRFVSFCLPIELFSIVQLPLDERLSYQEALEDFRFQFSILFPYRSNLSIKYYSIEPNALNKNLSAVVFGIENTFIELIDNFTKNNGLKLFFIDNAHSASNLALINSNSILCKGYYLSIYIQKKNISYNLSFNQKILRMKSFNYNRIGDLPELLNSEFEQEIFSKINVESLSASFISGDEISPNLVSLLRKSLNIDFILFNPFDKLKTRTELFDNKFFLKKYNSFSSALGIALRLN
jgi:hypothetical protein